MYRDDTMSLRQHILSSKEYFECVLNMQLTNWWRSDPSRKSTWNEALFEGFVTSADTGSEDLVRASRTALIEFCDNGNRDLGCELLIMVAERNIGNDRVLIPALEVIAFLFDMQIIQKSSTEYVFLYIYLNKSNNL
jgi:hypothetical protein